MLIFAQEIKGTHHNIRMSIIMGVGIKTKLSTLTQ